MNMKFKNTANYFLAGWVLFGGVSLMAQDYYEYIDFVGKDYSSSFLQGNYSNSHIISNNSYKITIETTSWDVGDGDDKETHYLDEYVYRKNGVIVKSEIIQSYHTEWGEVILDYTNPDIVRSVEYSVSNKAANFEKAYISKSDFSNSVFSSTLSSSDGNSAYRYVYSNIYGAYFSQGEIADSSFYNTSFYANLDRRNEATTYGRVAAAFFGSNISDSNFEKCNFTVDASMGPEDFSPGMIGAQFEDIKIENSSFSGSKFLLSSIPANHFGGSVCVSFHNSELNNVDFSNCTFEIAAKEARPDAQKTFMSFTNCKLNNVDLSSNKYESNVAIETPISFGYCELSNVSIDFFPVFDGPVTIENLTFNGVSLSAENIIFLKSITKENARGFSIENSDLSGRDYKSTDLSNIGFMYSDLSDAVLENANFTNATIKGSNFSGTVENGFTKEQLYSTKSYKDKDLGAINMTRNDLSNWDFSGQNLECANFSKSNLDGATFEKANLMNAKFYETSGQVNFVGADLRGAEFVDTDLTIIVGPNTIGNDDGKIERLWVDNASGNVFIRKYTPVVAGGEMISAKVVEDGYVAENASLILEEGAVLEVIDSATLNVFSNLTFNVGNDGAGLLVINEGSTLAMHDSATITIDLAEDVIAGDFMFEIINFEESASFLGLGELEKNKNLFLTQGGENFDGEWSYDITADSFIINVSIPEPSTYAATFGVIALVFAAYRRR